MPKKLKYPSDPIEAVKLHLQLFDIFDVPKGRHQQIIEDYCSQKQVDLAADNSTKAHFIASDWHSFNSFLEGEQALSSNRIGNDRQAVLEPQRMEIAINKIQALGLEISLISTNEINFKFQGSVVKYFPYSGWASGKTIKDGRGLQKLLDQLSDAKNLTKP